MKTIGDLKDRNGNNLFLNNKAVIDQKIKTLKYLTDKNPTKGIKEKIESLFTSEVFSTLFIEGEISSRRNIKKIFKSRLASGNKEEMIIGFLDAYLYALKSKEFSISNIFTLYTLLSHNLLENDDKLNDGMMFRHDKVFISSNKLDADFEGFNHKDIEKSLKNLFDYLNNSSDDVYLKAIIGHIYFEIIHPYFDFNGRTGRFIPMWVFSNNNMVEKMMYFATAMNNYRKQYLALFNKNIDIKTNEVYLDHLVKGILDLLILNQRQYIWIKKLENTYINKTNKSFSAIQKDFIWMLMIKSELSKNSNSWFKLTKDDKVYIEKELKDPLFSKETIKLRDAGIIKISSDKPRKYHLNNYKLLKDIR